MSALGVLRVLRAHTARRLMRRALSALVATALASAALAHKSSDAYLSWQVQGARIEQRIDIALRDLDRELTLDANDDAQLTWGEVRTRWPDIARLASAGVQLQADGRACTVVAQGPAQLEEHTDGRHAVLQSTLQCAAPVATLQIDYRLFERSDASHRGIARTVGATTQTWLLVPGAGRQDLVITDAAQASGHSPSAPGALAVPLRPAQGLLGFVGEGMRHISVGLDHLLFLASLLMVAVWQRQGAGWAPRAQGAAAWLEALRLVSAFTLAHSLTLGLAAAGVLAPPTRWVESLIALSVLLAALDNLRPFVPGPRWAMAGLFGLVHGFGFAGPLQDLGLRGFDLALPLLGFNLGVELGQLLLVALLLPLATWLRGAAFYRKGVVGAGSAAIALVALVWLAERSLEIKVWP